MENPAPKRKRRWLRRIGWVLLACFVAFVLFHRPILRAVIHVAAVKIAAKQNIDLTFDVEGSVLTNLSLKNISALPLGDKPSPVERISIEEVSVQYSIPSLLRRGPQEFLHAYKLRNADIEVKPVEGSSQQKHDLASTLHDIIQQPALFSDRVDIENLNLIAHTPDGEFALAGLNLTLDPVETGEIRIAKLQIPKVRTWENLAGTTTYAHRDMILRGLQLDPEIIVNELELDASQRAQGINRLAVNGVLFGGDAQFSMWMREIEKKKNAPNKADVKIDSRIRNLSLEKLSRYFNASTPAIGSISDSTMNLSGDPNNPASWTGSMVSQVGEVRAGSATLDQASARVDAKDGTAVLNAVLNSGSNSATAQAQCELPQTVDGFIGTGIDGTLTIKADELGKFAPEISDGNVTANGTFALRNKIFKANLDASAKQILATRFSLSAADFKIELAKELETKTQPPAIFDGLQSRISADFTDIRADKYGVDSGTASISVAGERVEIESVELQRADNTITASGKGALPRDMKSWSAMAFDAKFAVSAPNFSAFNAEPDLTAPNAQIEANGNIANGADGYEGKVDVAVTNMTYQDFAARSLALNVTISKSVATIDALKFALNDTDGFAGSGHVEMREPFVYDAKLDANVRDLSKFNALVQNMQGGLAGTLALNWKGSGKVAEWKHAGDLRFVLNNGKAAGVQKINAEIAGSYSPELIDLPTFWVTSSKGDVAATIGLKNRVLTIGSIGVKQAGKLLLTGSATLPLDLRTPQKPETIIPLDGPVAVELKSTELHLEDLPQLQQAPAVVKKGAKQNAAEFPMRGIATATLTAGGTIDQLDARLLLAVRNLQAKATPKLAPATVDLDMRLVQDQLSLKGRVQQPAISPVEIAGTLPLPIKQIVKQRKIDEQSPVQLSVRLARSSVAFLSQVTPAIRYVEGTASVTADMSGTIAQPQFSGSALLDLPALRLTNQDMPAVSQFRGDLRFEKNQLTVNRLGGDISGGSVNVTGTVLFPKLTDPQINLRMTSGDALLVRNESLTVRADSDVRVVGPLNAATVSGTLGLTHSKFFREIEILPIELPGRPAPKPPQTTTGFSIDKPPLRDWKFDVAIKTKDPFAVRGNLANGAVNIDLSLVGTGRAPTLDGTVRIENFVASLPFSKLNVTYGYVYFSPDEPFVPKLDIQGTSTMRDYNINVYIYGSASEPQTIFSAEPPLPQEDIIALLATGTTASELTGNGDVLAGRAAALLFQKLYRKVFKAKEPSENESFVSRFNVDVGAVDPRTGQQEVSTRFKLGENFYLIGDLDVTGNIRGQVKYLLRFR